MKKLLAIIVLGLWLSVNAYADSKFDKELKKISKTMVLLILKEKFILKVK